MSEPNCRGEPLTLKARYVFPGVGEPIAEGSVTIQGERIVAVGSGNGPGEVEDLGNVALLPGLVNAHTHLEFSDLSEPLGRRGSILPEWLREVVLSRRGVGKSPERVIEAGLTQSTACGTTSLAEIAQPQWPVELFERAGLDATVFLELIALRADGVDAAFDPARRHVTPGESSHRWRPGLSPHAPYSVHPELLQAVVRLSALERFPVAMHLAESREEIELLKSGTGPFRDFLERVGGWDPDTRAPGTRPLDALRTLASADRALVIHGNYLDEEEIAFLAARSRRMAVIYCPRSHAYFAHDAYPLVKMLSAGVTVGLGTDSRASAPDLSILAEMRFVAREYPEIGREVVLQLGTIRAAQALGCDHEVGSLRPGKVANLAAVALPDRDAADAYELLFDSDCPVVSVYYRGRKSCDYR